MLTKQAVFNALAVMIEESTVVVHLGDSSRQLFANFDREGNFYVLGSMGMPISIGTGLALGSRGTVLVFEGDGGVLMNMGSLATAASVSPGNLKIVVLDNGVYQTTGGQSSAAATTADLASIARASGLSAVRQVVDAAGLRESASWLSKPGLRLLVVDVCAVSTAYDNVTLEPEGIFERVRESVRRDIG